MMDRADVHFGRGPFGKLHVRFGKGANTSGPRPRWVPMLDGLDLILRWYLDEIRPWMGSGPALFCDEGGDRIHRGTIRNRLASLLEMEQAAAQSRGGLLEPARFSPHAPARLRSLPVTSGACTRWTHRLANLVLLNRTKNPRQPGSASARRKRSTSAARAVSPPS